MKNKKINNRQIANKTMAISKPQLFVVKNQIENSQIVFISSLYMDVLTGNIMMLMSNENDKALTSTCKIYGRVINEIVNV